MGHAFTTINLPREHGKWVRLTPETGIIAINSAWSMYDIAAGAIKGGIWFDADGAAEAAREEIEMWMDGQEGGAK